MSLNTTLQNYTVHFHNSEEFHLIKQELYTHNCYYFETDVAKPYIIDAGAHIGMATLYFKYLYPDAIITAVEPHPENLELLQQNILENQLRDITIVPKALAREQGHTTLYTDMTPTKWHSTTGTVPGGWNGTQRTVPIIVETIQLSDLLTKPVDLLKLDIEGLEQSVLIQARAQLKLVKHLIVEFHPHRHQELGEFLDFLRKQFPTVTATQHGKEIVLRKTTGLVMIEATR